MALDGFDPNTLRTGLERELLRRLARTFGEWCPTPRDYEEVRREWFWTSELLVEPQLARSSRLASTACARLGVGRGIELFQKAGNAHHLNAATNRATDGPILVQLHGPLLERLDDEGVLAVLGHEIGHHLAHGPRSLRGTLSQEGAGHHDEAEHADFGELDTDPLEEKFVALERELEQRSRERPS